MSSPALAAQPASAQPPAPRSAPTWTIEAVSEGGERVTHLLDDNCYRAHLSIYQFAARHCQGAQVLDAGSGAGYGTAYLASHGAAFVHGVDVGEAAVAFSRDQFRQPNLAFHQADLVEIDRLGFAPGSFDVIFSSNALEHVADVAAFFRSAQTLLNPEGIAIIAVPPITNDYLRASNVANQYHLNIWSPRQWDRVLGQFFAERDFFLHNYGQRGHILDFNQPMTEVVPTEAWTFPPASLEEMSSVPTMTAVFIARKPRAERSATPIEFVDASFTRPMNDRVVNLLGELVAARERQTVHEIALAQQAAQHEARHYQQQLQRLQHTLAEREQHIKTQQDYIQRVNSGRVLRMMNWLRRTFKI